jgi:hypothetical protein
VCHGAAMAGVVRARKVFGILGAYRGRFPRRSASREATELTTGAASGGVAHLHVGPTRLVVGTRR